MIIYKLQKKWSALKPRFGVTRQRRGGFTLVELLVVISIIGILSSLAMVSVNVARVRARDAKRQADIAQVRLALYLYYDDHAGYPNTNSLLPEDVTVANWQNVLVPALHNQFGGEVYMVRTPIDPLNTGFNVYKYTSNGQEFVLQYYMEQGGPKEIHEY